MAVKFTKGQICNGTISKNICHKEYIGTIYMESFILVSQSAQLSHYAALLFCGLLRISFLQKIWG